MMRVVLGARSLLAPLTGIGQYTYHLARGLQQRADVELTCFYGLRYGPLVSAPQGVTGSQRATDLFRRTVRSKLPGAYRLRRLVEQARFDFAGPRRKFDVYHDPNYLALDFQGPRVITVHDLSWIRYPETHPPERVRAMDRFFEPTLRGVTLALTDSESVRTEVLQRFGLDPGRVVTVPLGVDALFRPFPASETAATLSALGLEHGSYFLCVGTLEPRKNLHAAIAAYRRLPQALRQRHPLVLVGMKGWRTSALERVLDPMVASGEVKLPGYLAREDLARVIAGALTLVYPSLYEGFGLPPLEAMACGVPPIISKDGSLREVVGDCGVSVDAQDVDALATGMARMAEDPAWRSDLSARSLARAATFTWDRCVERTVDAYRRAAAMAR